MLALPDDMESLFSDIHDGYHILPLVLFANQEFVLGGEGNSATFANQTKEGHVALYQLEIARSPIVVGGWIAKFGVGCELLRCFSLQGRQTMPGIEGGFQTLHRFVELFLGFEGLRPKEETIQQTIQVLHDTITPGLPERDKDRSYT